MSRKSLAVTVAVAALAATTYADVPDGRGGRTSASKAQAAVSAPAAPHACCSYVAPVPAADVVANPAELKAIGHAAWISRGDVTPAATACYKRVTYRPATAPSPVELKTRGYIAARDVRPVGATRTCCESGRCPMRPAASASR